MERRGAVAGSEHLLLLIATVAAVLAIASVSAALVIGICLALA